MSTESIRPAAEECTVSGVTGHWMLRTRAEPLGRYVGLHGVRSEPTESSRKSELQLGTTRNTERRVLPRRRARRTFRFAVSIAVQRDATRAIVAAGQLWARAGLTFGDGDDASL